MKCPKCGGSNVYVLNTYKVDHGGSTQRRKCADCGCVITTATLIVSVDPRRGQGAAAVASDLRKKKARLNIEAG